MTLNKSFANLILLFCLFPYITFIPIPSDTQPYALILSLLYLFIIKSWRFPKKFLILILVFFYSTLLFINNFSVVSGRSLFGYLSILIISLVAYNSFDKINVKIFNNSIKIWLFFGIIQQFVSSGFGSFLISRSSTSADRGVTSLAVEPSYYSIVCIFLLLLNDIFYFQNKNSSKRYRNNFILITLQFLLSRSGIGLVLYFVYLGSKIISQTSPSKIIGLFTGVSALLAVVVNLYLRVPNLALSRIGRIINLAIPNPFNLLLYDGSSADRFSHIIIPFSSLFQNYGKGYGFEAWDDNVMSIASNSGSFIYRVANVNLSYGNRIMSGWGTMVFELGLLGLFVMLLFFSIMLKSWKNKSKKSRELYLSSMITIFFTMIMAVPIAFPLFSYTIGIFVYLNKVERQSNIDNYFNSYYSRLIAFRKYK